MRTSSLAWALPKGGNRENVPNQRYSTLNMTIVNEKLACLSYFKKSDIIHVLTIYLIS